jgi:hypothetical protein
VFFFFFFPTITRVIAFIDTSDNVKRTPRLVHEKEHEKSGSPGLIEEKAQTPDLVVRFSDLKLDSGQRYQRLKGSVDLL